MKLKPFFIELADSITARMVHSLGKNICQVGQYDLPMSRSFTELLPLPEQSKVDVPTNHSVEWRLTTLDQMSTGLEELLSKMSVSLCAGLSRALKTKSEKEVRVVATLMPSFELSSCLLARGVERTRAQFMYILTDCTGVVQAPRNPEDGRLVGIETNLANDLRAQLVKDLHKMADKGLPLASGFWNMIGREPPSPASAKQKPAKETKKRTAASARFEVDCIVKESRTAGRARVWYLVRWQGYDPSWEEYRIHGAAGSALETWEPQCNLLGSEALEKWTEEEEGEGEGEVD